MILVGSGQYEKISTDLNDPTISNKFIKVDRNELKKRYQPAWIELILNCT